MRGSEGGRTDPQEVAGTLSGQSGHRTARRTGGLVENDPSPRLAIEGKVPAREPFSAV
jgi:hypothetical protein